MANIEYTPEGGIITWGADDFLAGSAPQHAANSNRRIGPGARFMREFDPFRLLGYASPGYMPADVTTVAAIDAVQKNGVVNNGATPYAYTCGGTKVHQTNLSTDTVTNAGAWPHAIAGSAMEDIIIYRYGGTKYLFVSYYDGTDLEIATWNFDATWNDTFWSGGGGTPTGLSLNSTDQSVPHPMIVGPNGILYIGDGKDIASVNGPASTGNTSALDLPPGYIINSFAKTEKYLVAYAYLAEGFTGSNFYRGDAKAYFWDMISDSWQYEYTLDDNYVSGGFIWRGTVGCFTNGRGKNASTKTMALRIFEDGEFKIANGCITGDNPPGHGGVEVIDNMIHWMSDGKVYSYGNTDSELKDIMVHRTSGSGTTNGGMLKNFSTNKLYASTGTTTSGGLQTLSSNYNSATTWQSLMAEPQFPLNHRGEISYVVIDFDGTASGGREFALTLNTDRGSESATTVITGVTTITVQTTAESATSKRLHHETNIDSSSVELPEFSSIGLTMAWGSGAAATDAPKIASVKVYYTNIPLPQ